MTSQANAAEPAAPAPAEQTFEVDDLPGFIVAGDAGTEPLLPGGRQCFLLYHRLPDDHVLRGLISRDECLRVRLLGLCREELRVLALGSVTSTYDRAWGTRHDSPDFPKQTAADIVRRTRQLSAASGQQFADRLRANTAKQAEQAALARLSPEQRQLLALTEKVAALEGLLGASEKYGVLWSDRAVKLLRVVEDLEADVAQLRDRVAQLEARRR